MASASDESRADSVNERNVARYWLMYNYYDKLFDYAVHDHDLSFK